jgi:hypothetical protein
MPPVTASAPLPRRAALAALALPILVLAAILGQFLLAGLAVFEFPTLWGLHRCVGLGVALLALVMLAASFKVRALAASQAWIAALVVLYAVQIILIWLTKEHALALAQALHPFNGSLILVVAVIIVGRVASHGAAQARRPSTLSEAPCES